MFSAIAARMWSSVPAATMPASPFLHWSPDRAQSVESLYRPASNLAGIVGVPQAQRRAARDAASSCHRMPKTIAQGCAILPRSP
jgi:hypothetical protein